MATTQPSPAQSCPQVITMTTLLSEPRAHKSQIRLPGETQSTTQIHAYELKTVKELVYNKIQYYKHNAVYS